MRPGCSNIGGVFFLLDLVTAGATGLVLVTDIDSGLSLSGVPTVSSCCPRTFHMGRMDPSAVAAQPGTRNIIVVGIVVVKRRIVVVTS